MKKYLWCLVFLLLLSGCGKKEQKVQSTEPNADSGAVSEVQEKKQRLELPYELDGGKLVLKAIFQSTIANPDCNDKEGENIASVEILNQSGEFLSSADITVILEDGTELNFRIMDIPAGTAVWAFETGNAEITQNPACQSINCKAEYEAVTPIMELLNTEENGTSVTFQNLTDNNLTDLNASFHCLFEENVYYGGITCQYPIEEIPAGESITLEIEECYLGSAQAVRVEQKK